MRTDAQLLRLGKRLEAEGKKDLSNWILNHPKKSVREELLDTVWQMEDSDKKEDREKKPRMEILTEELEKPCAVGKRRSCESRWLQAALELLQQNGLPPAAFAAPVRDALENGRGKGRNVIIIGYTDRGSRSYLSR